jgi:hypothetical protein
VIIQGANYTVGSMLNLPPGETDIVYIITDKDGKSATSKSKVIVVASAPPCVRLEFYFT